MSLSYKESAVINYAKANGLVKPKLGFDKGLGRKRELVDSRFYLIVVLKFGFSMQPKAIAKIFNMNPATITHAIREGLLNWNRTDFKKNTKKIAAIFPYFIDDTNILLDTRPTKQKYQFLDVTIKLSKSDMIRLETKRAKFGDQSVEETARRLIKMLL